MSVDKENGEEGSPQNTVQPSEARDGVQHCSNKTAQNGLTHAKLHVTKPRLKYYLGFPRNGDFSQSPGNRLTSPMRSPAGLTPAIPEAKCNLQRTSCCLNHFVSALHLPVRLTTCTAPQSASPCANGTLPDS